MSLLSTLGQLVQSGLGNLAAYLAAHVLLCLVPAFFIAGGLSALIPKESVTRFLGRNAPKFISYPAAALAGSVLAVCSCTIVPLFAGIYKKGAGLGPGHHLPVLRPGGQHPGAGLHRRRHRRRPGLRPPVPLAGLRHRHRPDHGADLPPRGCRPRQSQTDDLFAGQRQRCAARRWSSC